LSTPTAAQSPSTISSGILAQLSWTSKLHSPLPSRSAMASLPILHAHRIVGDRLKARLEAILNRLPEPSKTGRRDASAAELWGLVIRAGEQGAEGAMPRWLSRLRRGPVVMAAILAVAAGAPAEDDLAAVARD